MNMQATVQAKPKQDEAPKPKAMMVVTDVMIRDLGMVQAIGARSKVLEQVLNAFDGDWLTIMAFNAFGDHVPVTVRNSDVVLIGREHEEQVFSKEEIAEMQKRQDNNPFDPEVLEIGG